MVKLKVRHWLGCGALALVCFGSAWALSSRTAAVDEAAAGALYAMPDGFEIPIQFSEKKVIIAKLDLTEFNAGGSFPEGPWPATIEPERIDIDVARLKSRLAEEGTPIAADRQPLEQPALALRVTESGAAACAVVPDGSAVAATARSGASDHKDRRYWVCLADRTMKQPLAGDLKVFIPATQDKIVLGRVGTALQADGAVLARVEAGGGVTFFVGPK